MDRAELGNEPRSCCWTIPAPTHQRGHPAVGCWARTARDIEVTTQVSPSHPPSKSFSRLLTNTWDVLRENIPSCALPSCAPLLSSCNCSRRWAGHRCSSWGRGSSSKPTL